MGTWFFGIIRGLFAAIDKIVVGLIEALYGLIIDISKVQIFENDVLSKLSQRVTAILTIFMIFKLSFSFLTYILNPEQMTDKSKGFGKIIQNVAISLVLLTSYQFLFDKAMDLQLTLINNNTIPKLIFGPESKSDVMDPSLVSFPLFSVFVTPNSLLTDANPECAKYASGTLKPMDLCPELELYNTGFDSNSGYSDVKELINQTVSDRNTNAMLDYFLPLEKDGVFAFDYWFLVSTAFGVVAALLLLSFCFDVAIRTVKLGFLRLIAPIPIISYVDPNKGEGVFKKWLSTVGKTYADLFIRLVAIFFALFLIQQVSGTELNGIDGKPIDNPFIVVFIILGALMFAKQFPKLIQDITGISFDSKLQLNPLKKLEDGLPDFVGKRVGGLARTTGALVGNQLRSAGRLTANSLAGGGKYLTGKAIGNDKLKESGSRTLRRGLAKAGNRSLASLKSTGKNIGSSLISGKYNDETASIYSKGYEKSNIAKQDVARKEGLADMKQQQKIWERGKNSLEKMYDPLSEQDYRAVGFRHKEFINSMMAAKNHEDGDLKIAKNNLDIAQSNMTRYGADQKIVDNMGRTVKIRDANGTIRDKTYADQYREAYDAYEKEQKIQKGLEANHERNRKIYTDDAELETGRKIAKGPSPDGNWKDYKTKTNATTSSGSTSNGPTPNGSTSNGSTSNGSTSNGSTPNGSTSNGSTSNEPTSNGSTSNEPTSNGPTPNGSTSNGSTSNEPTSNEPTSNGSTSNEPTSNEPTSNGPTPNGSTSNGSTSNEPTSNEPTSNGSTSNEPTSNEPTSNGPTSNGPTSNGSTPNGSTSNGSTSNEPTSNGPTSNGSTPNGSTSNGSTSNEPTSNGSTSNGPTSNEPTSNGPTPNGSTSNGSTSNEPTSNEPTSNGSTSNEPTSNGPTSNEPTSNGSTSNEPTSNGPTPNGSTSNGSTSNEPYIMEETERQTLQNEKEQKRKEWQEENASRQVNITFDEPDYNYGVPSGNSSDEFKREFVNKTFGMHDGANYTDESIEERYNYLNEKAMREGDVRGAAMLAIAKKFFEKLKDKK